jgi:hypothetical protein
MFRVEIRSHRMGAERPDLSLLRGVVSEQVLAALRTAAERLSAAKVRHALAGALAVGAHGYPRASKDIDFVVGDEAFKSHAGGVVTIHPDVPIRVGNVAVDPISVGPDEAHLLDAIESAPRSDGIPVLPIEALVYMKVKSPRRKDSADVVELLKAGIDGEKVSAYLSKHAPALLAKFDQLAAEAESEQERP